MITDQNERLLLQKAFSALEAMIAEFRALDLPYGSKAYFQAVGVRNELWQYQSCPTPRPKTHNRRTASDMTMNCTICGRPIRLIPSAQERAKKFGGQPSDYIRLFTTHSVCAVAKRRNDTYALMRGLTGGGHENQN